MTRGFLGLTVACARCHDHKYDPIPTTDYYALAGVFASTDYVEVPAAPKDQVEAYDKAQAAIKAKDKEITAFLKAEAERLKQKVDDRAAQADSSECCRARPRRSWRRCGPRSTSSRRGSPPKYPVIHALAEAAQAGRHAGPGPRQSGHARRQGPAAVPDRPGRRLRRDSSRAAAGSSWPMPSPAPDNPLTARVMVNRVWQHHFGRGLVATASNFGSLGERPSHPELLDWLAHRFVARAGRIKALHREIMLSATYQQSSRFDSPGIAKDPGNTLLWRMNRRRLDVEAWRDAMLAVAGRLDARSAGPRSASNRPAIAAGRFTPRSAGTTSPGCSASSTSPTPTSPAADESRPPCRCSSSSSSTASSWSNIARAVATRLHAHPSGRRPDDAERISRAYLLLFGRDRHDRELRARPGLSPRRPSEAAAARDEARHRADPLGALRPGAAGSQRICVRGLKLARRIGTTRPLDAGGCKAMPAQFDPTSVIGPASGAISGPDLAVSRRALFCRIGGGFGALGLASVLADAGCARPRRASQGPDPGGAEAVGPRQSRWLPRPPHFPARAKRVIFLFMNGGPSHVDTFDPKPALDEACRPGPARRRVVTGRRKRGKLMPSPFSARPHGAERHRGERALPARCRLHRRHLRAPLDVHRQPESRAVAVDDELGQHAADPAEPGLVADLRPGHGEPEPAGLRGALPRQAGRRPAVVEQQLPAWHLPGHAHQQPVDRPRPDHPRRHQPPPAAADQRTQLDLLQALNREHLEARGRDEALEARIASLEMAFRMQFEAREAFDLSRESAATRAALRRRASSPTPA